MTVEQLIERLRLNIADNLRAQAEASGRIERDQQALVALEGLLGMKPRLLADSEASALVKEHDKPRGEEAIRLLLGQNLGGFWSSDDIHATLELRGWISTEAKHPRAATEAALARLVKKGVLSKNAGVYHYMGDR